MAWRLARSLDVLRTEVRAAHPGTRVDTIGDQSHASGSSDHNPNANGVVCAADFFGDKGLDLAAFAAAVVASRHPALKYVIYNRRIWSVARAREGWRRYTGPNPHATHVHVSVGTGPDGRSTGPYDTTTPWGIQEDDMPLTSSDINAIAARVWSATFGPQTAGERLLEARTLAGEAAAKVTALDGKLGELAKVVGDLAARPAPGTVTITDEQLERVLRRVLGGVDGATPQG